MIGNSKWLSNGKKKYLLWNLFCCFPALPRMVGAAGLGNVEMSQDKEGNILFILKLEGFRNSFFYVASNPNSPLPLYSPCPVVVSSQDKLKG